MLGIASLYITLLPVILAGMGNMIVCKSSFFTNLAQPIDQGYCLPDGRPLFGANKTWKGFWGMVVLGAFFQWLWGLALGNFPVISKLHLVYGYWENVWFFNLLLGGLLGLAYVVFELPNSFIKRRLSILPGKLAEDRWRWLFFIFDQIDSLIGCALVLKLFTPLSWLQFVGILLLGAGTHVAVNQLLYTLKLRKNPF